MPHNAGDELVFTVVFRNWNVGDQFAEPIDPDSVVVNIYEESASPNYIVDEDPATRDAVGTYSYVWTASADGVFVIEFIGAFDSEEVIISDKLEVGDDTITVALGEPFEFSFITELDPMYVDPEEFLHHHSEVSLVEVAELVYRRSLEVQGWFDNEELPYLAYEYIRAAVECSIARTYDISFAGGSEALTLGDLKVSRQSSQSSSTNRANAGTPCELAAVLREELMRIGGAGMRAVVTGSKYKNPMPNRHLKDAERWRAK